MNLNPSVENSPPGKTIKISNKVQRCNQCSLNGMAIRSHACKPKLACDVLTISLRGSAIVLKIVLNLFKYFYLSSPAGTNPYQVYLFNINGEHVCFIVLQYLKCASLVTPMIQ